LIKVREPQSPAGARASSGSRSKRPSVKLRGFNAAEDHRFYVSLWRKARRGDRESARHLIETFCLAVDGKGVPRPVFAYLQSAFTRYLRGEM